MRSSRPRSSGRPVAVLRAGGLFLLISALCGLLVAAIALPAVGGAAVGAKAAQGGVSELGIAFDPPAQSQRSEVLDANGDVLAYFYDENRVYVGLDKIAPVMR